MARQRARGSGFKLISDPFDEWVGVETGSYPQFGQWIDAELAKLELRYGAWETLGYAHWRKTFTSPRIVGRQQAEAAE